MNPDDQINVNSEWQDSSTNDNWKHSLEVSKTENIVAENTTKTRLHFRHKSNITEAKIHSQLVIGNLDIIP